MHRQTIFVAGLVLALCGSVHAGGMQLTPRTSAAQAPRQAPVRVAKQWMKTATKKVGSFLFAPRAKGSFQEAMLFAAELHKTQVRKGTQTPYFSHLMGVSSMVLEYGGSEEEAIAALLHDGPEDQGGEKTLKLIEHRFGTRVAHLVDGLTDSKVEPKPAWRPRKEMYLRHLATTDDSTRLVSMADKLYNARAIVRDLRDDGPKSFGKFAGGHDGVLWYYRSLVDTYNKTSSKDSRILKDLTETVDQMHDLAGPAPRS